MPELEPDGRHNGGRDADDARSRIDEGPSGIGQRRFPPALQKSGVKPTAEVDPACLWAARRIQRQLFSDAFIRA